ncbi:Acyl carrier protein [Alteromonadaceae bacterium Bs31]|nr:Acyl carrier protein [Alteromonadaceae bacterium Bs31]
MNKSEAKKSLLHFISDNYMVDIEEIPVDQSLIDEGIIDSFGLVEISSFLEKSFEITIEEADLIRDNFGSVNKMIDFAERKRAT